MQGIDELSKALLSLAQKILNTQEFHTLTIAKLLLMDIDKTPFKSMFDRWGCKNFASLRQTLQNYYLTSFEEHIRWDSNVVTVYGDDFVQIFIFILDLALKSQKSSYIQGILTMDQSYQQTLQPFVKAVTQRQSYIQKAEGEKRDDNLFDLLQQNEKLKRYCDQWIQKYQELKIEYDQLKVSHQKASEQLHFLKQDHQLINQIGGSGTVEEALEKVRKDFSEYQRLVQRLKKELEQKKVQLSQREDENRNLQINFKTFRNQLKSEQLQRAHQRIKSIQESYSSLKNQQEQLRLMLEQTKASLKQRDCQIENLKNKISTLEAQAQKFTNIRKLHNQYKDKIFKDFRDLRE